MTEFMKTVGLFFLTAVAEMAGCYLPYLWLRQDKSALLLIPAAISLLAFVWLLTLHPFAAGRAYAAYGGMYVAVAVGWLWWIQRLEPTRWDLIGAAVTLAGMAIIVMQPQRI
jgi:small multidrug resistance family-3 protein